MFVLPPVPSVSSILAAASYSAKRPTLRGNPLDLEEIEPVDNLKLMEDVVLK